MKHVIRLAAVLLYSISTVLAQVVQCKMTRGNSPSFYPQEMDQVKSGNNMKIKYSEQFGLADFDVSAIKGKRIKEARLCLNPAGGEKFNLNEGTDLTWLSVTTVSEDWDAGKACANRSGLRDNWGWPGAKTYDVACGNGNTLRCNARLTKKDGVHGMPLDTALVKALVAGASYGLFIMDGSTHYSMNCRIQDPFLMVVLDGDDKVDPSPPTELKVDPSPKWATEEFGSIQMSLKASTETFSYDIKINGKPVQRWQIPFPKPGETQSFNIVDLPPDTVVTVDVEAVDGAGNKSATARATGKTSPQLTVPQLPVYGFFPKGGEPKALSGAKIYAFPEITKIDPTSGKVLHETMEEVSKKNPVWDGLAGLIRLAAARGEIISFQIGIDGNIQNVKVEVSNLTGPGTVANSGVKLWRNWYVNRQSEYALPWTGSVSCPMADNKTDGQMHQAVTVDYHIPKETKPGDYTGKVTLSAGENRLALNLRVKVYNAVIPDDIFFNPELNCYGGPGQAGSPKFLNSYKIAHYNRCTINRVPYSQNGTVHSDWSPDTDTTGKVTDWARFDQNLGSLLDGTLFKNNPRSGVPVATMYLPLFEGWPLNYQQYYDPGPGVPKGSRDPNDNIKHHILAKPIEEAMSQPFKNGWTGCVRDFYTHAKEKGWNKTVFECYLNNKPNYGYTAWTLDEPNLYRDWEALNFFGSMWKKGINDPEVYTGKWMQDYYLKGLTGLNREKPTFFFRGDISRMNWQGTLSDGLMNVVYVGGGWDMFRTIQRHKARMPAVIYYYGGCNDYSKNNWESAAWCLKAFAHEGDGVVPWQSLGTGLTNPDPDGQGNALIVDADSYGDAIASFRVHALRRGAQNCELLRLLVLKKGWNRQQAGMLASQRIPLSSQYKQKFTDEAAALAFGNLSCRGFVEFKEGVLKLLEQP
ncbi:MAG: hypothetical protein WCK89_05780 [bacterium]